MGFTTVETKKFAELHVHLEGCIWEEHIKKYSSMNTYLFPPVYTNDAQIFLSFNEFLGALRAGYNYLGGLEQYVSVFKDFISYMIQNDIVYSELQINLALINTFNLSLVKLLTEFNTILQSRSDLAVRFIIDLPWQFQSSSFELLLNDPETYQNLGVVAISMGGNEVYARPKEIAQTFREARRKGFKLLCHAGETTSFNFARSIVQELEPDRIAHGLSISDWLLSDQSQLRIIDTCLTSNRKLGLLENISDHPFGKWLDSENIIATLSTDDPAIFGTTLSKETDLAIKNFDNMYRYFEDYESNILRAAFDSDSLQSLLG